MNEEEEQQYEEETVAYPLEVADVVGVTLVGIGNIVGSVGVALHLVARELLAHAAWRRARAAEINERVEFAVDSMIDMQTLFGEDS